MGIDFLDDKTGGVFLRFWGSAGKLDFLKNSMQGPEELFFREKVNFWVF